MLKLTRISKSEKVEPGDSDGQAVLYVEDEDVNWEVAELSLRSKFNLTRAKNRARGLWIARDEDLRSHPHGHPAYGLGFQWHRNHTDS